MGRETNRGTGTTHYSKRWVAKGVKLNKPRKFATKCYTRKKSNGGIADLSVATKHFKAFPQDRVFSKFLFFFSPFLLSDIFHQLTNRLVLVQLFFPFFLIIFCTLRSPFSFLIPPVCQVCQPTFLLALSQSYDMLEHFSLSLVDGLQMGTINRAAFSLKIFFKCSDMQQNIYTLCNELNCMIASYESARQNRKRKPKVKSLSNPKLHQLWYQIAQTKLFITRVVKYENCIRLLDESIMILYYVYVRGQ